MSPWWLGYSSPRRARDDLAGDDPHYRAPAERRLRGLRGCTEPTLLARRNARKQHDGFLRAGGGTQQISKTHREEYFRLLGIPPLPEKATISSHSQNIRWLKSGPGKRKLDNNALPDEKDLDEAIRRPWTREELPRVAAWLAMNTKPLTLAVEASKRPRRFEPMVGGDGSMIAIAMPNLSSFREVVRALAARAMFRAAKGNVDTRLGRSAGLSSLGPPCGTGTNPS